MTAHTPTCTAEQLGVFDRDEIRMGRTHWTPADYREHGRRKFDEQFTASRDPMPGERERFADIYVRLACPPRKIKAAIAATKAEFPAVAEAGRAAA